LIADHMLLRYVLEAVVSLGGTYTFLTPHWVYRAGTIIIQNMPEIYEANVMAHMKSKYRPNWADKLRLGDVRI
jgi:hypothetical protein